MKAFVTGASGHLGYHLCKQLAASGADVKAFVRKSSFHEHLQQLPVEICYGDVLNADSLKKPMEGADAVFHAAAVYKLTETGPEGPPAADDPIVQTAVQGTRNLFDAAAANRTGKIIYTSSVETIGLAYDKNRLLDESVFTDERFYVYSTAKIEAERLALDLSRKTGIHTVICNPATIIGKDDYKLTPSNNMLLNLAKNSSFYVEGGQSLVDVEDVAAGHVKAMEKGRNRERYILSGRNIEIRELIVLIRKILGAGGPLIKLNKVLLYPASIILEAVSSATKRPPLLTRRKVLRSIGSYSFYDNSKARRELDYNPAPLENTLPATLDWLLRRYK